MSVVRGERVEMDPAEVATFGPFRLFPTARRLEREGVAVEIGGRALDILVELVNQAGRVVSKAELMSTIWADTTVVEGVLRTHIYNLRRALKDGVGGARYVTSVAGRGYCFVAPVVRSATEASTPTTTELSKLTHDLPPRLARMAGRDDAIRNLAAMLVEHRFVTIIGAAGIGKTTVAVSVAHALLEDFGGAVHFIELEAVTDPSLVAATVASTLGVLVHTEDALVSVQASLRDRRILLVLDNCEHVVGEAARLAEHLFLRAPRVHMLATSREALRVEGERIHRLGPLETPAAVHVFLERAAASGWSADLDDAEIAVVEEMCERLDGVALAIELAASFVGECGLQGAVAMLDDRLRLLWQHSRRSAPARQQTLHALVGWSYDRLPERERVVLRRLSAFIGAFPLDAARSVVFDEGREDESLPEILNELVGKSLLSSTVEDGSVVYRMLETTRVYALERLAESGELAAASLRHASFFARRLLGKRASDLANVRAGLRWCFSSPQGYEAGVRLAAAAARMLLDRGLVSECYDSCRQALDVIGASDRGDLVELELKEGMAVAAMFTRRNSEDVRVALVRAVELARVLARHDDEVRLLGHLNSFLIRTGDFSGALELAERSFAETRGAGRLGSVRVEWMLGLAHHVGGNQALAQEHLEAALRRAVTSNEEPTHALLTLARTLWLRGQADRAATVARSIIDEIATVNHPVDRVRVPIYLAPIFIWRGEWSEAERLVDMLAEHVDRHSLFSHRAVATALQGELLMRTGRPREGCSLLRKAASTLNADRHLALSTALASALAEGLAATGFHGDALDTIERAVREAERRGGTWDLPELLRVKASILASVSPEDARTVDGTLAAAIELARRQGALAWELRAATTLARERLRRGRHRDGVRELAAAYARFTEGMETPDLQAARSLLERH
jgi:predicted ATPase/DNA-binding winged helix-turn-helix (wHTH) protein